MIDIIEKENKMNEFRKVNEEAIGRKDLEDLFGSLKDWKIDPQKAKDELREECDKIDNLNVKIVR